MKAKILNETCLYCDDPAVVEFEAVADPDDACYSGFVCTYHWRYVQLCHRHAFGLSLMSADALDGRQVTIPFRPYIDYCYPDSIWPVGRKINNEN